MFKIGVIIDSFRMPLVQAIEQASRMGIKGIQMYATEGELSPENMSKSKINELNDIVASNGLVVSALCGDFGGLGFMNEKDNMWRIEKSKRIINLALELNTNIVTTHIGLIVDNKTDDYRNAMQIACNQLGEYAAVMSATFAVETGPEKATVLKEFLDELSNKGVGVNLDPANLVMVAGDDPVEAVYTLKDYIVHTHAKDGIRLTREEAEKVYGQCSEFRENYYLEKPLGKGKVDFNRYLKALSDIGYNGFLTIEREVGESPIEDIALAVSFLEEKIESVKQ